MQGTVPLTLRLSPHATPPPRPVNSHQPHPPPCTPLPQAGGAGSTGTQRVLDVDPTSVHQRVPLYIGSKKEVEYLESFTKKQ